MAFIEKKFIEQEGHKAKRKTEQDKSKAQEIRKTVIENLGNGKQDDATLMPLKNKTRRSESEVVGYLKDNLEQGERN